MWNDASTRNISTGLLGYHNVLQFPFLEIRLQMKIAVHKHVSGTGNQNTARQKGSAAEGFQRTSNWDSWLGIKQRMETEVGHRLNFHTATNTILMLRELQLETPRHKPHTSPYVPHVLHGLESHSKPTARNLIALHIPTVITVWHTVEVHWSWQH
jgi:hypothetical protein